MSVTHERHRKALKSAVIQQAFTVSSQSCKAFIRTAHCVHHIRLLSPRWDLLYPRRSPVGSRRSAARSWSPNSSSPLRLTLCLLSHRVGDGRPAPPPPPPPPSHPPATSLPPLPDGPTPLSLPPSRSLSTFIYIFIYFTPALRVTVFNIIGETWLLSLNAEITGAFFLSSSPLHFSRVAPRGRNIFISPCAPSFKTFTPAVWKIFLIFLPHGVEKSP